MNILALFRSKDWLFSKLIFNYSFFICGVLVSPQIFSELVFLSLFFFIYIISVGSLGYFINDLFDVEEDRFLGRSNFTVSISNFKKSIIIIILLVFAYLPCVLFIRNSYVYLVLISFQILLFLLYSIPVVRLKRNFFGIISDSLFSFVIPGLISFLLVFEFDVSSLCKNELLFLFLIWLFFIGLRSILMHQYVDYGKDILSKTKTFATGVGVVIVKNIVLFVLCLEFLSFIAIVFIFEELAYILILISSVAAYCMFDLIIINKCKIVKEKSLFNITTIINVYYNYYIIICVLILASISIHPLYLIPASIILLYRLKNLFVLFIKRLYYGPILYLFYKLDGLINRLFR